MNFEQNKSDLLTKLHNLRSLADEAGSATVCSKIDTEIQKLTEERFHLVVLGQFKRGKTTLINAILGERLLPTAIVPLTSVLTLIRYGKEKYIEVVFQDQKRLTVDSSELENYITERGNPNNEKNVRYVEIKYPSEFLRGGIVLIDTPGIGSLFSHNTETTYNFIPNIDAAIFVLSSDPPITASEHEFIKNIKRYVKQIFFILNKVDTLSQDEIHEIVEYNTQILQKEFQENHITIHPLSSRLALDGKMNNDKKLLDQSNLPSVQEVIRMFLENNKGRILLDTSLNRAINRIAEVRFTIDLELKTIQTPLITLEQKIKEFRRQVEIIKKDRTTYNYLLENEVASLEEWIGEELEKLQKDTTNKLQTVISNWLNQTTDLSHKQFIKDFDQKLSELLISHFDNWREHNEPEIRKRYQSIISDFTNKTNEFINNLIQLSAELFEVNFRPFSDIEELQWKQTFYYQFGDAPLFLEIDILNFTSKLLPKSYLRKIYLKRIKNKIAENVMLHCGRLRYEYSYSLKESYRKFLFDMNDKINELIKEINIVLDKAVENKKQGEAHIQQTLNTLQKRLHLLSEIEKTIAVSL